MAVDSVTLRVPLSAGLGRALTRAGGALRKKLDPLLTPFGRVLGGIFYIPDPLIGLLLWIALLRQPSYAVFALVGLATGAVIKRTLRIHETPILGGGLKANALMAAIVTGWMTSGLGLAWGPRLGMASAAALAATLVSAALLRAFSRSVFPPLLWGYCLVAIMLFKVCPQCTVVAANTMPAWPVPQDATSWGESFLRSMGSLMYTSEVGVGLLVCLAILLWSRTMFLNGLAGWISGVCVALAFQHMSLVYYWLPVSYNYFITGMALGSVVFLPGRLSLLVAVVGGCAASFFALVLQYALDWSAIAYLPVSSAVAIWVGVGAFTRDRSIVRQSFASGIAPEERWWLAAYWYQRFGPYFSLLAVPVSGELKISQGFAGDLSHTGAYAYALDFQRPATAGSIWGASVLSPVSGIVERIKNTVPDNAMGECNYADKWGNFVVIRLDKGGWVLVAHLQQGTVAVAPGARVETGNYLGLVGNSGRSPVPHLHLQHQDSPEPGAPTTAFRLANYLTTAPSDAAFLSWNAAALPAEGDVVMAAPLNLPVYQALAGIVPGSAVWMVEAKGRVPRAYRRQQSAGTLRVDILLDEFGQRIFQVDGQGSLVSRLDLDAWRITELRQVASPFLKLLALAVPSIPYAAKAGMHWQDLAPTVPRGGLLSPLVLMLAPYFPRPFLKVVSKCLPPTVQASHVFQIDSRMQTRSSALPFKVTCEFAALRGPVKLQADFYGGSLVYTLLSYEPGRRDGGMRS